MRHRHRWKTVPSSSEVYTLLSKSQILFRTGPTYMTYRIISLVSTKSNSNVTPAKQNFGECENLYQIKKDARAAQSGSAVFEKRETRS